MADTDGEHHFNVEFVVPEGERDRWLAYAEPARQALIAHVTALGEEPDHAPPIPVYGVEGEIQGPFRLLLAYDIAPIVGVEDEPDGEGEPVYIYGPPCWRGRVDTLTKPMKSGV